jgi:hypothetical protein
MQLQQSAILLKNLGNKAVARTIPVVVVVVVTTQD